MALEQVNAFYDTLMSEQAIYEQYYRQCCVRGIFGIWDWDKTKIVHFAATLGYSFSESELDAVLFGSEPIVCENSINLSEYRQLSSTHLTTDLRKVEAVRWGGFPH